MADVVGIGGGDKGLSLIVPGVPDATLTTEITALIVAKTKVVGKLVSLTFAANYGFTSPAEDAIPDGRIVAYKPITNAAGSTAYLLDVDLWSYIDQNSARHTAVRVRTVEYEGTLALQDSIICYDGNYRSVDDGGAGGWGAVISLDTTNSKADVVF